MIRFLFRFFGLWILAAGFLFLIYDGVRSIAANSILLLRVDDFWSNLHQTSLLAFQHAIESLSKWLWNPVMTTVLNQPIWVVFAVVGTVLILLGRKKKPLIGYARD